MSDQNDIIEALQDSTEESGPDNFFIDILTGNKERTSAKKLLVQKILRQLIESYGFDRNDLEVDYNPQIPGQGRKRIDIAVFRPNAEHNNEYLQRIIVCKNQKKLDKLRFINEADTDLLELKELLELIPGATLGMWTNGQEEFLFQVERTRFEVRTKPLGVWPVPGERTTDLDRAGGVIQVSADAEDLEDALLRCRQYLNRNLGLDHKDSFKQLAVLMLAKIFDETQPTSERKFWIRGDEPFTEAGQQAIALRISEAVAAAKIWQPNLLTRGWDLTLEPHETSRVVMELARYNLSETQPRYRTGAFRTVARGAMDGREGRYPTPLNVAEMVVEMLDPQPEERVMDCSSGTGTFLAMTAAHIFKKKLAGLGTTPEEASKEQICQAQNETAAWAASNALGCDIDPFLAVASRMNLLFTTGNPGRVFRIDARTFPDGDLDGIESARPAMQLGSMDMVMLNPWFSTQDTVTDPSILERYDLGNHWERDEEGGFRNTGNLSTGGVPPEVLFIERALKWVKPGTGRVGILLPDGLLGNPGDEYVRWWILHHCEVLASVDLPVEPFKVTVKEYGLSPALPSLLLLRRRSQEELINTEHREYRVFMAVVDRAGVDARGNLLFLRAPNGEELVFDDEVIERVREGGEVEIRRVTRRNRRIHDELPLVAEKYKEFRATGEVTL
ncbi:TPA: N-6 DNA methylase [Klebsiella pneumoniae]|uniref:methylation-associated defense system DNA methyltransferase MAD2 n=1 Tax=Klebsiella pneumoniae complex TaxID=3390273 RepID=UPI0008028C24|nr:MULTISPECIES: N-6 DNA methylase [Klebsiella]MBC4069762.1 N-6 DNA methylase [Klebsiella pneumoniae]MBZ6635878.1 N-6 DNA methylase [Klebsiella pneumoniae]MCJ7020318.1 N-6 DNA methylase [Klebsiella pneumoniae]MDE4672363.1 N-6 DNA methylase [Klebsiella pneumoniae]SBG19433.1 type I restriction-modification system methyltransferase subunit [Klebsiella pneumoniae]